MEVKILVRGTMKITTPTQRLSSLHVTFKTIELHGLSVRYYETPKKIVTCY